MKIAEIWQNITEIWKPTVRENRTTECDETINRFAPEKIKRSPGHQNLSQITEEPEWYHE